MLLGDYLPPEHIIVELKGNSKLEIIEELLKCMHNLNLVNEFELAFDDILAREGYLSTGLENGVAIPHAKTGGIDKALLEAEDLSFDWHGKTIIRLLKYQVVAKTLDIVRIPFRIGRIDR